MEAVSTFALTIGVAATILTMTLARYQVPFAWKAVVILVVVDMLLFVVYRLAHGKE